MKRLLAITLVIITLNISVVDAYAMPVYAASSEATAASIPLTMDFLYALLGILGITTGMGVSLHGLADNIDVDLFNSYVNTWDTGESVTLDNGYQLTDLRVNTEFLNFLKEVYQMHLSYGVEEYGESWITAGLIDALNLKSYIASGTLASKSFANVLKTAIDYYEGDGAANLQDDLNTAWSLFTSQEIPAGTNLSDVASIFNPLAIALISMMSWDAANEWYKPIDTSIYNEYDLYTSYFDYNGVQLPYLNVSQLDFLSIDNKRNSKITIDDRVCIIGFSDAVGNTNFYILNDIFFTLHYKCWDSIANYNDNYYSSSVDGLGIYSLFYGFNVSSCDFSLIEKDGNENSIKNAFYEFYVSQILGREIYLDNAASIYDNAVDLSPALDDFYSKELTAEDVIGLSDALAATAEATAGTETATDEIVTTITEAATALPDASTGTEGTGEYSTILGKILAAIMLIATSIWDFFATPVNGILSGVQSLVDIFPNKIDALGEEILTLPKLIATALSGFMERILEKIGLVATNTERPWEGENKEHSADILDILNGLILLISILFVLLRIFIHCLQFIINIFAIPAGTAFLPDEVIMGLDYLKSLEITGLGMSVYDFMMALVYIFIVFFAIRVLRVNVDRIRLPRIGGGGKGV